MDSDGVFPNWSNDFSSPSYIQIVGAGSGECPRILREICVYLRNNNYNNAQAIPLESHQKVNNIESSMGTVFIFFSPKFSPSDSIETLNHYVISGANYWIQNYTEMIENTAFIFQGESEVLSNKLESMVDISPENRSKITEEIVDEENIEQLENTVLTNCMSFEWKSEYE